jgi:uncharacterized membrane protein
MMTRRSTQIGWLALGISALAIIGLPSNWAVIGLAVVAVVALARDPRFGWLPAGLLVSVALPFGRGADYAPLAIGSLVVRAQDPVLLVALAAVAWQIVRRASDRPRLRPGATTFVVASAVFLGVGAVATVDGVIAHQALRDILRDVRWWGLYVAAPLAILAGVRRDAILRAVLLGVTAFAVVVAVAALLPAFNGGLKDQALAYDRGTLRMQFGNSVFLVGATAYAAYTALRTGAPWRYAWVGLLVAAQILSLTRISLLATAGALFLIVVVHVARQMGQHWGPVTLVRVAILSATCLVAFASGILIAQRGSLPPGSVSDSGVSSPEDPLQRITFGDYQSGITGIIGSVASGGRMATYVNALQEITPSPILGGGMGQLVQVAFANRQSRSYTLGFQPGVDNAFLTIGLKAGAVGVTAFAGLLALPLIAAFSRRVRRLVDWYLPALIAILAMTMTQSFAVSGYAPYVLSLFAAVPFLGYAASSASAALSHRNRSRIDLRDSRTTSLNA